MQPTLPKGFISIEEAVKLINSDTRKDAKVDTRWLVKHIDWLEEKHNFRIPLMKTTDKGAVVPAGNRYVEIVTSYDKEVMKKTIRDHYRDMVGHEYDAPTVHAVSSVADDEESGGNVRPRKSKSIAKEGTVVGTGETIKNSDGLSL